MVEELSKTYNLSKINATNFISELKNFPSFKELEL